MKTAGRGLTADRQRFGLRRVLVVSQVAISLVLVAGALLFVTSLRNLITVDAGFRPNGLLVVTVNGSHIETSPAGRTALNRELLAAVRKTRGVVSAASAAKVPISGDYWNENIEVAGQKRKIEMVPWFNRVSAGYFQTMDTPMLAGRDFNEHDTTSSPVVAIVNQKFRDKFLGKANPIGQRFRVLAGPGEAEPYMEIVGVVKNSKYVNLRRDFEPTVFVAESQDKEPAQGVNLLVRSDLPLRSLMPALRRTIRETNAGLSFEFVSFQKQVDESLTRERLMATLSGLFGLLAGVLAMVGLYGVISYMVARRQGEIGIRIALGATRGEILKLIFKEAGYLLLAGLAIGTVLELGSSQAAAALLYGLKPTDPRTIGYAIGALAVVSLSASLIPAIRAARVEPMAALREE